MVIKAVEQMAYNEGIKSLKFKNRHGVIFHDTDWIAGVDCDPNDLEIRTGEFDEESEPYEPDYLAGEPEDDEMDVEEIDPDEINDILHDVESNPNKYQGQDQEESETNEPDYLARELEEDTSVDPVEQELYEEQEEPSEGQEHEETAKEEHKDSQPPNVRRLTELPGR